jgi:hypothetical protein
MVIGDWREDYIFSTIFLLGENITNGIHREIPDASCVSMTKNV